MAAAIGGGGLWAGPRRGPGAGELVTPRDAGCVPACMSPHASSAPFTLIGKSQGRATPRGGLWGLPGGPPPDYTVSALTATRKPWSLGPSSHVRPPCQALGP